MNPYPTYDELQEMLTAHAQWAGGHLDPDTGLKTGKRLVLQNAHLMYRDLSGRDLRLADFAHCNMAHADLSDSDLRGTILTGVNLEGATLPAGWAWWQGGAYGPELLMVRVLGSPDGVTVMVGCLEGSPDVVKRRLFEELCSDAGWVYDVGRAEVDRHLACAVELIDIGVRDVTADLEVVP